jgi:hypothetical protein
MGIDGPVTCWRSELVRVGMGYQFGDGLEALRFNLGLPF